MVKNITKSSINYGYVVDKKVFGKLLKGHKFKGVTFKCLDGSVISYTAHRKGDYHIHNSRVGRVDGLTAGFREFANPNPDRKRIDIYVNSNNVIIITELP